MGRTPTEDPSTPGRSDSSGPAGPHLPAQWAIERHDTHSVTAQTLGDWVQTWKDLEDNGWAITVLISNHGYIIGFGYHPDAGRLEP